jgi:hypothetical protein
MGGGGPDQTFEPAEIRYIKLGENRKWATDSLEQGIIPFGYRSVDHGLCVAGNWDEVRRQLVGMGRTARGVSQGLRELKDFYGLPENTLWGTMANGHFWWAFAEGPVVGIERSNSNEPARYRRTRAGWSKTSLTGEPLTVRSLSSALTRTASYQMTICAIKHADICCVAFVINVTRSMRNPRWLTALLGRRPPSLAPSGHDGEGERYKQIRDACWRRTTGVI